MDIVFGGLNFEVCLVYIDDVCMISTSPEKHLERLEMVLERLKRVNLKLKPSKYHLMQWGSPSSVIVSRRTASRSIQPRSS